jgi:hypothetical protein
MKCRISRAPLASLIILALCILIGYLRFEGTGRPYQALLTTWHGKPAFGQLRPDETYTFYKATAIGQGRFRLGPEIMTVTKDQSIHLH